MTVVRTHIHWFLAAAMTFAPSIGVKAATTDPDAGTWEDALEAQRRMEQLR